MVVPAAKVKGEQSVGKVWASDAVTESVPLLKLIDPMGWLPVLLPWIVPVMAAFANAEAKAIPITNVLSCVSPC